MAAPDGSLFPLTSDAEVYTVQVIICSVRAPTCMRKRAMRDMKSHLEAAWQADKSLRRCLVYACTVE
jgi:hypothetical protein